MLIDKTTGWIIVYFLITSFLGHKLLHRIIKTPAEYEKGEKKKLANVQEKEQGY